ncbi:MAG TPA: hypothetical protein VF510_09040 [Ktedonobacterales bacterium]
MEDEVMRRRWLLRGTAILSMVPVIAGLRFIAAPAFISSPDTVHIVVTEVQPPSRSGTVIFDHRSSQRAGAIYAQLVSGGPLTNGASCPAFGSQQPYYHYELTFFHLGVKVATATSDAIACQTFTVEYPAGSMAYYSWVGKNHISFWARLHQLVNVPEPIGICMTMPLCHS